MKTLGILFAAGLLAGCAAWRAPAPIEWPTGTDPLYVRGATALLNNDVDAAIAAWRSFVDQTAGDPARSGRIRGYLTLLERESAKRFARQLAAQEKSAPYAGTDRLHLALFPFRNQGPPTNAAFNRAVLAMVSADLSKVPALVLLEREKVEFLLRELKLAESVLVDPASLRAPARLLGAGTVVAGTVYSAAGPAGPGSGRYQINAAVSDVRAGRVLGSQEADGLQSDFHVLLKRIVHGILDLLDIDDRPAAVDLVHTRSWAAYARFAAGLNLLAEDRFDEARKAFREALDFDPAFALAEAALGATPEKAATLEEMRRELRARR